MKYAVCSEVLAGLPFDEACGLCADYGFSGIEIAPFDYFRPERPDAASTIKNLSDSLKAHSLECIGFHYILKGHPPLYLLEKEGSLRRKAWDRLRSLVDVCAEMGGRFLVLGSGRERSFRDMSRGEAGKVFLDGLFGLQDILEKSGIRLLLEPLPSARTNFITTLAEAGAFIEEAGEKFFGAVFDFHNCDDEALNWEKLVTSNIDFIKHVHLNDRAGRVPERFDEEYAAVYRVLRKAKYNGWVSLETFGDETFGDRGSPRGELDGARRFILAAEASREG